MFDKVQEAEFIRGEHQMLRFWQEQDVFRKLRAKNAGKRKWSFLDGPITANNPMGVHHAWGRTYKDTYQRYFAMTGRELRYQNGFDCQGLWVEVEVEKELKLGTKKAIHEFGIDRFVNECKKRVLKFAARQTEQSVRLGYWMDWDDPGQLRKLAEYVGTDTEIEFTPASGTPETGKAHNLVERLGNPEWGGSYFTFATENNETIWTFLKKCFTRGKVYRGHDVMPWSGRGGSAYSQMEVADGRRLTVHRSVFVRFPLVDRENEYLLVWTTTPWTLTSNVAAAVNPDLDYVKIKTKRDDAIYYFAKDNLNYQRLGREFKEGFGRPEWSWPENTPKLKTIAQIFKEQGGFEELGTIKGAEMVGWRYEGPFDDLPAQQYPGGWTALDEGDGYGMGYGYGRIDGDGYGDPQAALAASSVGQHRVVDGGRDSRGNPHVVAGEGTGIVHIAPGCGDVDNALGKQFGLPIIAPLRSDGCFGAGFGDFTGKEAIDPATADLVFERLKEKHLLVSVEQYPHIYPHCWRTGDELVFRLVDEWFINMDWRDEIKDVTREIEWLPASIDGQEREIEWLTNMRDWMISKKRFWGLALPIWINPDDPTDFEVIGSLAELKERAVDGWDDFEGNTPHRPWIDGVKIKSAKTGAVLSRIEDVGNPWLDAGIVPFSTMMYNSDREAWKQWYPADLVTECFPGQFRNWFYAMLSMSTMMRYDETDDPKEKRPFKTLLGHRLVMDEEGRPMHKSDGTAIWFEEAAEQLGVDTIRWMYLAQNPASDLRFGTRHPHEPVALQTPEGEISETKEGLPTCRVTSKPADDVRRQVMIPLWNSYVFFVNYAVLDGFDPNLEEVPVEVRPEIDRWILSNLQSLIVKCRSSYESFDVANVCSAVVEFIDDLSNWYIRRNRRRFWRAHNKGASGNSETHSEDLLQRIQIEVNPWLGQGWDEDKLAAYQTLYGVLVTLSKIVAPAIPFIAERMYQNLVRTWDQSAPESVHLCSYPRADDSLLNAELNQRTALVKRFVRLGHRLREEQNIRVRQPLPAILLAGSIEELAAITDQADVLREELNVKKVSIAENLGELVRYGYKPNLKTLGPKYGKLLGIIRKRLPEIDPALLDPLRKGESVKIELDGNEIVLEPDDVLVSTEQAADWACGDDSEIQVALSLTITAELEREGIARDFVRQVQQLRKDAGLEIEDRINVGYETDDETVVPAIVEWDVYVRSETLADAIEFGDPPAETEAVLVGGVKMPIWIAKVS